MFTYMTENRKPHSICKLGRVENMFQHVTPSMCNAKSKQIWLWSSFKRSTELSKIHVRGCVRTSTRIVLTIGSNTWYSKFPTSNIWEQISKGNWHPWIRLWTGRCCGTVSVTKLIVDQDLPYSILILWKWMSYVRRRSDLREVSHLPFPSVVVGLLCSTKAGRLVHFLHYKPNVWEDPVMCDDHY